tara:strand:+ start:550 stop:939 length:390 start_codon:yes stop_codon:yes gene_type:complete
LENLEYFIDFDLATQRGRDLRELIISRCPKSYQKEVAATNPPLTIKKLISGIKRQVSKEKNFINSEFPIKDIIFRTMLSGGNKPIQLSKIHYLVTETWATPIRPLDLSLASLKGILDADTFYCFNQVSK